MSTPTATPNRATTTHPERSSRRVAHKAAFAWFPWLLAALIALVLLGTIAALVAADRSDPDRRTAAPRDLSAVSAAALIGGGGITAGRPDSRTAAAAPTGYPGFAGTVLFAENSADLDSQARRVIDVAAAALRQAGVTRVEVTGYTDVIAGRPVNAALSQQRADAVAKALEAQVAGLVATTRARGEADPAAPNSSPAGRQQNRRATIVARA